MTGEPGKRLRGLMLFGLFLICLLFLSGCSSLGSQRSSTAPKEHTGPISVDITAVPAGSTTLTILKDKQDCDSYSNFDAKLFAHCMENRGYAVSVYGADHQQTTIEELYTPKAEGQNSYPVRIYVSPPGRTAQQENLDFQECETGQPPTQAIDQMFLDCIGNKGYRVKIYRPGYVLSNIGKPLPAVVPSIPPVTTPYPTRAPDQATVPSGSSEFHLSRTDAIKDVLRIDEAYLKGKQNCPKGDAYNACLRNKLAVAVARDALDAICKNRDEIGVRLTRNGLAKQAEEFEELAPLACGG
jgi:hypothetical protein